jgi:DNA primase
LFGNEEVGFTEEITNKDEDGKKILSVRKYQNLVSAEIYLHLQEDEIEFTNPLFQEIYAEIIHQLNQTDKLVIDQFVNHQNTQISTTVTSILMDEEKHQLSNWESKNIEVKTAKEVLPKAVSDVIYNLRRILIDRLVHESLVQGKEYSTEEKEVVMSYNSLRIRLSEKLKRVV